MSRRVWRSRCRPAQHRVRSRAARARDGARRSTRRDRGQRAHDRHQRATVGTRERVADCGRPVEARRWRNERVRSCAQRHLRRDPREESKRDFQINHPRSGGNGYFDLLDFDRQKGIGTDPRYDARFDAIELWNGRNVAQRNAVLEDVLALLRTNHPVTITGTTDTHGMVGQEAGYPRTYLRMKDDDLGA